MELRNSINTYFSRLKFELCVKIYVFGWKMRFLQSLKLIFEINPKFYWKAALWVRKYHTNFQGNMSTIKIT